MSILHYGHYERFATLTKSFFQWVTHPGSTGEGDALTSFSTGAGHLRLRAAFWLFAAVLAFAHAWANRHELISSDGLPYLDVATAYLRGDWTTAINSYWSPLYSWLLAAALAVFNPQPYWEVSVLRLVNLAIFLFAMACFDFVMREFIRWRRWRKVDSAVEAQAYLPEWVYQTFGYCLFVWFSIFQIMIPWEHPDMLLSGFIYLAVGLLLRIQRGGGSWLAFAAFGATLGVGYLAKAVMFPLAFVFLLMSLFAAGKVRKAIPRTALAMVVFLIVAAPFITALSKSKGRVTFGETGRLSYAWFVNLGWEAPHYTTLYWEDEVSGVGTPVHPLRKVHDAPAIYEFATPVGGTYPPWYDPSYWYEGIRPHPELSGQLRRLVLSANGYYQIFFFNAQFGLMVGMLILYLMSDGRRLEYLARHWVLIIPGIAAMTMYSLVWVEPRFVAAFLVLLWLGLFSGVRLSRHWPSAELSTSMALSFASLILVTTIGSSASEIGSTARALIRGEDVAAHQHWQMADGLSLMGAQPGDKLAIFGRGFHAYWARLAGLKIVAELPQADSYWAAEESIKSGVIRVLAGSGARFLVAENIPANFSGAGWQKVGDTKYYVYRLPGEIETTREVGK